MTVLGISNKIASIALVVLLLCTLNIAGATSNDQWENISSINDATMLQGVDLNSATDSIFIAGGGLIQVWGIINTSYHQSIDTPYSELHKMDWNDRYQWMAWFATNTDPDSSIIWKSDVVVFDINGRPIAALEPYGDLEADINSSVVDIQWCPGMPLLSVAFDNGTIIIYNLQDMSILHQQDGFRTPIKELKWNPSGTILAILAGVSSPYKKSIYFYDLHENISWEVPLDAYDVEQIEWYYNGELIFLRTTSSGIKSLDIKSHKSKDIIDYNLIGFSSSPIDSTLIFIQGNRIFFYNYISKSEEVHSVPRDLTSKTGWTIDGSYVFFIDVDNIIRFWRNKPILPSPIVGIDSPSPDTNVSNNVTISGWAESYSGESSSKTILVKTNILNWIEADGFYRWNYSIDTRLFADGPMIVRVKAIDSIGESDIFVRRFYIKNSEGNIAPNIEITSPSNGTKVGTIFKVNGVATDDKAVLSIQYQVEEEIWKNMGILDTDAIVDWHIYIPIFYYELGFVNISFRAFDGTEFSSIVSLSVEKVKSEPVSNMTVFIDYPRNGWTVPQTFKIYGHVDGLVPEKIMILLDDNTVIIAEGTDKWESTISHLPYGFYQFRIRAVKGEMFSAWAVLTVDIRREIPLNHPPSVEIINPSNGTVLFESRIKIEGLSYDDIMVQSVEIRISNGKWKEVNGTNEWTYKLHLDSTDIGYINVEARSFDGEFYSEIKKFRYYYSEETPISSSESMFFIVILVLVILAQLGYIFYTRRKWLSKSK